MGKLSDEVYTLARGLIDSDDAAPLIDIRVDVRGGANSPDWHCIVWDGQTTDDPVSGETSYAGLGVLAAASGIDMGDVLTKIRDVLKQRSDNQLTDVITAMAAAAATLKEGN